MNVEKIDGLTDEVLGAWQKLVNTLARAFHVPAALIMRVSGDEIEVFVSSESEGNPYRPGDKEEWFDSGLYCERVIRSQQHLLVPDALADPDWEHNPDVKLGMISYLGLPIRMPDGEPFGTICVLDSKKNSYSELYLEILEQFRNVAEADLRLAQMRVRLDRKSRRLKSAMREMESLRSIIPVCMHCRNARDDDGYWMKLESYLLTHEDIGVSHSLCPECADEWEREIEPAVGLFRAR